SAWAWVAATPAPGTPDRIFRGRRLAPAPPGRRALHAPDREVSTMRKADFNAEEWSTIAAGPPMAGLRVMAAERGGTLRESFSMAKVYAKAREREGESRSEEHTSELQSRENLVCRLLLEKKK